MPRAIVVVPTYNEREMLPLFLDEFARTGGECLIVDDSSPDGTGELADELARERPWMHVLHRPHKGGLGAAYRGGFAWALERGYERDRPDGLRPLAPAERARGDAGGRRPRRRPRARVAVRRRRRHAGLVARPPRHLAGRVRDGDAGPRPAVPRPDRRVQALDGRRAAPDRRLDDGLERLHLPGRVDPPGPHRGRRGSRRCRSSSSSACTARRRCRRRSPARALGSCGGCGGTAGARRAEPRPRRAPSREITRP